VTLAVRTKIAGIEYYLPEAYITTEELSSKYPEWSIEQLDKKTGIRERHIASASECASDLAVAAASRLFSSSICSPREVDFLLFCTQSADYAIPTTACMMQHRLGIPTTAGALDFNLGCSGFVYGLGLANGLVLSQQATRVLLLTAETYSKYIADNDKSCRAIFGDGAAATLITASADGRGMGPFVYGTDGRGAGNLMVKNSGTRRSEVETHTVDPSIELHDWPPRLEMNGPEMFQFAVDTVPGAVDNLLQTAGVTRDEIDLFVFHQANAYMLEAVRKASRIPKEKFFISLAKWGNTVSSTIPIALKDAEMTGRLKVGHRVMLVGFGVGYSWAATLIDW
jgi:3-oxoacyl-[acyl-carrier-protein] synthase-3